MFVPGIETDIYGRIDAAFARFPAGFHDFVWSYADKERWRLEEFLTFWSSEENQFFLKDRSNRISASYLLPYLYLSQPIAYKVTACVVVTLINFAFMVDIVSDSGEEFYDLDVTCSGCCPTFAAAIEATRNGPPGIARFLHKFQPEDFDKVIINFQAEEERKDGEQRLYFCSQDICLHVILENHSLRDAASQVAELIEAPLKHLRFSLVTGKTLYLSEIRNKTPQELGLKNGDVVICEKIDLIDGQSGSIEADAMKKCHAASSCKKNATNKKRSNKQQKKKKRNKRPTQYRPAADVSTYLLEHSKKLSLIFEEADATFRATRLKLNNLDLKRSPPKRSSETTAAIRKQNAAAPPFSPEPENGKAGRIFYDVKIGEVASLYKTSKPSRKNTLHQAASVIFDLHGCTKDDAKAKLDSILPEWLRMAMEGSYPWVIRVRIVCGGGSQVLSEMVEEWIGQNESVANVFN